MFLTYMNSTTNMIQHVNQQHGDNLWSDTSKRLNHGDEWISRPVETRPTSEEEIERASMNLWKQDKSDRLQRSTNTPTHHGHSSAGLSYQHFMDKQNPR